MTVAVQHAFAAAEGASEHQEAAAGQVEVGEQTLDDAKAIPGRDHELGRALTRNDSPFVGQANAFQRSRHRRAHRHDRPPLGASGLDAARGRLADLEALAPDFVVAHVLGLHGEKGPRAHVQGDPHRVDSREALLVEVQTRRRRGHGSQGRSEDALIASLVLRVDTIGPLNVGRQGQLPALSKHIEQAPLDDLEDTSPWIDVVSTP